jgi:hypothetical protein
MTPHRSLIHGRCCALPGVRLNTQPWAGALCCRPTADRTEERRLGMARTRPVVPASASGWEG